MDKYLFLFYYESELMGWECFDPKEPVSEAMAVQQAFNMLICDDVYERVLIFAYGCVHGMLPICTIIK